MPVTWSDAHRLHAPESAVWVGVPIAADELPERAELIRDGLVGAGAEVVGAVPHSDDALLAVHDAGLVEFLRTAWAEWQAGGMTEEAGQPDVVGYIYPTPGLLDGLDPHVPAALSARTGAWAFDTMTPIAQGTWEAARAAVDTALTAADLVLDGTPAAYACCRPPGHHVTRTAYGGSCYLNNAAIAAQHLRARGLERVAIVDVDAHHGNGAQAIFRERADVLTTSVHVDPGAGWFPHFLGFADESGPSNLNVPLPPESGDAIWLSGVDRLAGTVEEHGSDALVVALGVDAAGGDPNSPLSVTEDGFRRAGQRLGALGLPTVFVQEGGYVLETVGPLVRATLEGFESVR
ncbi:MAG TPA: histone deacetylase family protein [Gaiellaceae bacterium]|jgi:acetoin utilization deacetylase AcuC-like enzyme|nr:histone deacetylase family protein [Gaiellaceae bacterium]